MGHLVQGGRLGYLCLWRLLGSPAKSTARVGLILFLLGLTTLFSIYTKDSLCIFVVDAGTLGGRDYVHFVLDNVANQLLSLFVVDELVLSSGHT